MAFKHLLEQFGRAFVPKKWRGPLREYLLKAGHDRVPYELFGVLFFVSVVITFVAFFLYGYIRITALEPVLLFLATLVFWVVGVGGLVLLSMFFFWTFLSLKVYNRTKEMESKLPDYLALVVTNLRSGMSFDKSLWAAIRPEFGVLAREITMVSKRVMTGNDTTDALKDFAMRYDSPILRRSINLIISEIESGGEIASVIERVIENLRKTAKLKKEMAASVLSYMLFIAIIVMLLAPILFALANTILQVILAFAKQISSAPGGSNLGGGGAQLFSSLAGLAKSGDQLTKDFETFSYLALGTTSMFSAMIVSIIEKGDIKGGLKYIPVFLTITLIVYFFANKLLGTVFGSLIS